MVHFSDEKTHDKSKPAEPTSHDEKSEAPKDENPNDMNKHTEALGNSIFTKEGQRYGPGSTFREDKTINKTHYPMTDWWQTNKMIS